MRRLHTRSVHDLRYECSEVRKGVLEAWRNLRVTQSRQIGTDQAILLGHTRNPRIPFRARFVIAVNQNSGLRFSPWLAKPVLPIKQIFLVVLRNISNRQAL